jgi:hypothetical protein
MTSNFNKKCHFPYTYGDKVKNDNNRISDSVVKIAKNNRIQNIGSTFLWIAYYVGSNSAPASAIPPEYGQAAAEAVSRIPETPAPGKLEGFNMPKMTYQQQQILAAQQGGKMGPMGPNQPSLLPPTKVASSDLPWYLIPGKPQTTKGRAIATGVFFASTTAICLEAAWNPIAAAMCGTGLILIGYNVASEIAQTLIKTLVKNGK